MWSGRVEEAQNKRLKRADEWKVSPLGNTQNVEKLYYNFSSLICQRNICLLDDCPWFHSVTVTSGFTVTAQTSTIETDSKDEQGNAE
ncbi:hypothetical protein QQF64_025637 [Cirrhinus molitorella]|uniref:Uncharacterized protein n=1 Tax=Cirrhinus molitorella TaxID=172907 RepID=A0ABR3NPW8_9TELE